MPRQRRRLRSIFITHRERRLWLLASVTVFSIYASAFFASRFSGVIDDELASTLFTIGLLLIGGAALAVGIPWRPGRREVAAMLGILAVYLIIFLRMTIVAERTHLIEYGVVAILIYQALLERRNAGKSGPPPALLAIGATSLLGLIDETIQWFIPTRVYDLRDVGFNALAAVMAVGAGAGLRWIRIRST